MYVNTLITLQENFSTYGLDGNKVTGHVTLNSPGLIKCYVQNLKQSISGQTYALYAFSKAKDKGVRIGALSSYKETKWMVDAKDVGGSGITLEEIDGIAVASEDNQRGVDTILMGFKNNRYMIIPLIDQIARKRLSPKPQTTGGTGNSEKPPSKPKKSEGSGNPVPRPPVMGCAASSIPKLPQQPAPKTIGNPPPRPTVPESQDNPPQGLTLNSSTEGVSGHMIEADEIPSDSGPSVLHQKDSDEESYVQDTVISNSSMSEYQEESGNSDTINIAVLKMAEMLKEEEKTQIHKEVTQELQRIINVLRENKEDIQENREVKAQIEKMRNLPQSHKLTEKPNIEKTLESRYMKQKVDEYHDEEGIERIISDDTTPKKALNFILKEQDYKEEEKQPQIDYISEIDKKIKEIEAKRKQEKY